MGNSKSCNFFPDEPWRCENIMIVHRLAGALSLIGCVLAILAIWLFKGYTVVQQRMVLFIAISGAGGNLANIFGDSESIAFCKIIAFANTFFDWAMLLWVVGVAIQLFLAVLKKARAGKHEWLYHTIIWPASLIIAILPFSANKYGHSGAWCWIVPDVGWRMGMWYGPLFAVVGVLFVLYIYLAIKLWKMVTSWQRTYAPEIEENKKFLRMEIRPLIFYPFVYFLLYLIPLANRIQNAVSHEQNYGLIIVAALSANSLGAANSLIYGLNRDTREKLTCDQIKTAWRNHFTPNVPIGEYSTSGNMPETPANYSTDVEARKHEATSPDEATRQPGEATRLGNPKITTGKSETAVLGLSPDMDTTENTSSTLRLSRIHTSAPESGIRKGDNETDHSNGFDNLAFVGEEREPAQLGVNSAVFI